MELPAEAAPFDFSIPYLGRGAKIEDHLLNPKIKYGYDPEAGLDNINYGNNNYRMICETIFTLAENYTHRYRSGILDKNTHQAIRYYINHIYDANWKRQQDRWIISDGAVKLQEAGVNFMMVTHNLWLYPHEADADIAKTVPRKHIMMDYNKSQLPLLANIHLLGKTQGIMVANKARLNWPKYIWK